MCHRHSCTNAARLALPHCGQVSNCGAPVAAVAALPNLQHCELGLVDTPLPNGPWLRSLQQLEIGVSSLMNSLPALQAASNITALTVAGDRGGVDWRSPAAAALFDLLAQNLRLERVTFGSGRSADFDSGVFAKRVATLCNQRPGLVTVRAA